MDRQNAKFKYLEHVAGLAAAVARETGVYGVPSSELTKEAEVGTL
jgi:hypothetical protein